jgi:hypothetical protein
MLSLAVRANMAIAATVRAVPAAMAKADAAPMRNTPWAGSGPIGAPSVYPPPMILFCCVGASFAARLAEYPGHIKDNAVNTLHASASATRAPDFISSAYQVRHTHNGECSGPTCLG